MTGGDLARFLLAKIESFDIRKPLLTWQNATHDGNGKISDPSPYR